MVTRVLIVDDSKFVCNQVTQILEEGSDFKVVGTALNGQQALLMAVQLEPDVITMDIEMPVMDGISAVKAIMAECPTAILMLSGTTHAGAKATLDALNAGAIDFMPKQLDDIDGNREMAKHLLRRRVRIVALQSHRIKDQAINLHKKGKNSAVFSNMNQSYISHGSTVHSNLKQLQLLVVVASTGGPVAIQKVLTQLSKACSFPILIIQHMPDTFTKSYAERLNQLCRIQVKEAEQGDLLRVGQALLAPGGMQIEVVLKAGEKSVRITKKQKGDIYAPCADTTLSSVSKVYTSKVLTVVMTGMGTDGMQGAMALKENGCSVWAQDEASCTIYGMPKAIVDNNIADKVFSLDEIANEFTKLR